MEVIFPPRSGSALSQGFQFKTVHDHGGFGFIGDPDRFVFTPGPEDDGKIGDVVGIAARALPQGFIKSPPAMSGGIYRMAGTSASPVSEVMPQEKFQAPRDRPVVFVSRTTSRLSPASRETETSLDWK